MDMDRLKKAIAAMVHRMVYQIDYLALYACKVVSQANDGTLEVQPEDTRLPPMTNIPLRLGLPGAAVKVNPGARVLLTFEGGDPRRPVACLWDTASVAELDLTATSIVLNGGTASVARVGDATSGHTHQVVVTSGGGTFTTTSSTDTIANGAPGVKA